MRESRLRSSIARVVIGTLEGVHSYVSRSFPAGRRLGGFVGRIGACRKRHSRTDVWQRRPRLFFAGLCQVARVSDDGHRRRYERSAMLFLPRAGLLEAWPERRGLDRLCDGSQTRKPRFQSVLQRGQGARTGPGQRPRRVGTTSHGGPTGGIETVRRHPPATVRTDRAGARSRIATAGQHATSRTGRGRTVRRTGREHTVRRTGDAIRASTGRRTGFRRESR